MVAADEGIDGVINEDRLGLDVIYVQAKRWQNTVGRKEIQSFVGASVMEDLENAIGQFAVYRAVLAETDPSRVLYLAVPLAVLRDLFEEPLGQLLLKHNLAQVVGFDPQAEVIVQWIS